jgi:hypothetical protein
MLCCVIVVYSRVSVMYSNKRHMYVLNYIKIYQWFITLHQSKYYQAYK